MKQHQRSDLGLVLNGDANRARTQPMRGAIGSRFAEHDRQAAALGGRLPGDVEKNSGMRDRIENNAKLGRRSLLELSPHAFFSLTITSIAAIHVPSGGIISISGSW
jgi:hypothetical protein